jgi:membrane protein required for colicin V production
MFIDIVFLLLMLLACVKGYSKGLIVALFSVVGFIAGLAAALKLSAYAAEKLSGTFNTSGKWLPVISFALVFLVVVVLVHLGAKLLQKSVEMVMLGWLNRIAGILLYALLYSILFSILLFYAVQLRIISAETIQLSKAYPYLQPLGPKVMDSLGTVIPVFKDMFAQLEEFFGKVPEAAPVTPQ